MDRPARPEQRGARAALPAQLHERALEQLLAPRRARRRAAAAHRGPRRLRLRRSSSSRSCVRDEDRVFYQEVDLVVTRDQLLTVRKTPRARRRRSTRLGRQDAWPRTDDARSAMIAYHLVDEIAERYLDLVDALNDEIDELEDHVDDWPAQQIRAADLRSSATTCSTSGARSRRRATRCAEIVDDRVEVDGGDEVFTHDVELDFGDAYDKLLRATDGLELSRDLVAGVARLPPGEDRATTRTRSMKRLTVDRVAAPPPDVHRRGSTARTSATSRSCTGASATVVVGADPRHDRGPAVFFRARAGSAGRSRTAELPPLRALDPRTLAAARRSAARRARLRSPRAVLHLPELQGAVDRPRRRRGPVAAGGGCRRCGFGFLFELMDDYYPAPGHRARRLRQGGPDPRARPRRLRADRLPRAAS